MKNNLTVEINRLQSLRTSHILHLILSIITVGIWIPIWVLITLNNGLERIRCERRIDKIESRQLP